MRLSKMTSDNCFSCNRVIQDHTKEESIECAINLCNVNEAVDACGIDGQLDRNQPTATKNFLDILHTDLNTFQFLNRREKGVKL